MIKRICLLTLCICLFLSGCGGKEASPSASAVTFTDDLGRTVTVDSPQRTAVLLGSFAQVWQLAGGQVVAAPDDAWEDLDLALPEGTVNLGSTKTLSLELLIAAQPDFVLASTNTRQNVQWKESLEGMGIPVAYFDIDDFDDYLRLLEICTRITGRPDLYARYGTDVQARIDTVLASRPQDSPTVLCMVASASAMRAKSSQGNVLGAMLHSMGCVNIADSDTAILEDLSIEHILQADPAYIFIVQRGDDEGGMRAFVAQYMAENPAWSQLTAVREGRVYFMEKNLFNLKPNHRWGEAYEILEGILSDEA